jgi:hypothetical protein
LPPNSNGPGEGGQLTNSNPLTVVELLNLQKVVRVKKQDNSFKTKGQKDYERPFLGEFWERRN